MQFVDGNLLVIHGATFWVIPLITVLRVGTGSSHRDLSRVQGCPVDRARLASSVQYLDVGIRTSWTSDCFRTLEFAALSLGLPFESNFPTTAVASPVVDDIVVINREPLATVVDLLEHQSTAS